MNTYYRVCAEIDLGAIKHNYELIRARIPESCKIMPIIKADGYGHGAGPIAELLKADAEAFGVATVEEALALRASFPDKPILILGTLSSALFCDAVEYKITVYVYTEEMALKLSRTASELGTDAIIDIAVDTGMGRIGVSCDEEGTELAFKIASMPHLKLHAVFTHFATADEADKAMALCQRDRFRQFCASLEAKGIDIPVRHACNSAAICDMNDECFDMVRPGIILYGLAPSDEIADMPPFESALAMYTHVSYIKKVKKGDSISYGATYTAPSDRIIATIPVGYADGYPRALSGKGRVIINGEYAPIVGRVCMDQFMVDVTDIPGVKAEDKVTLIGTDGGKSVTADEIARITGTINYEIVCGIGKRVSRVYKNSR